MDGTVVAEIDARLDALAHEERVALPLAVESGSRAWGFPSPDSDYDCRFVFVRPPEATFSIVPARDVTPVFDVGGWELHKALQLLLRGNAVIIEWLTSPITYRADAAFRTEFLTLTNEVGRCDEVLRHYVRLAGAMTNRIRDASDESGAFPLKKLFYVLRPLVAARWLLEHGDAIVAPMHFPSLLTAVDLLAAVRDRIEEMLEVKKRTRELGTGRVPPELTAFVDEASRGLPTVDRTPPSIEPERIAAADRFHRRWVERLVDEV